MRDQIVTEARSWKGTPFRWQASVKGLGCDCKGLVIGVARACGLPEAESLHARMADYGDRVDVRLMKAGLAATLRQTTGPLPGDVILLHTGGKPQHLAMLIAPNRMIHTHTGIEKVSEAPFTRVWPIDSFWTWPSLEEIA